MMKRLLIAAILSIGLAATPFADAKKPSSDIVDFDRLEAIKPALDAEVEKGLRAGFVAGVATRDGETFVTASGMADRENGVPMTPSTRFRIASMTKPVVTAAMMMLVERGVVTLNDPVSLYVPAYADARVATAEEPGKNGDIPTRKPTRPITIHDLLAHTAGVGYIFDDKTALDRRYLDANLFATEGTLAERIDRIARLPLYNDPGVEWRYSYATDIAGLVIEMATGEPLEDWLKSNLFEPLGMNDTEFFLDRSDFDRLAVVYDFDKDGRLARAGAVDAANRINEDGFGIVSGGAGLVSSAPDYLRFTMMMLNDGELDGARVLSPSSVRLMMSDNLMPGAGARLWEHASATFGLGGLVVTAPGRTGGVAAAGEWGWTGLWDTWFVVNPQDGIAVVLMAQTQPGPSVPPSRTRNIVKSIAYGAVRR